MSISVTSTGKKICRLARIYEDTKTAFSHGDDALIGFAMKPNVLAYLFCTLSACLDGLHTIIVDNDIVQETTPKPKGRQIYARKTSAQQILEISLRSKSHKTPVHHISTRLAQVCREDRICSKPDKSTAVQCCPPWVFKKAPTLAANIVQESKA